MNERIKELAEQAGFLNKDEESIEYFAELIVRGCADYITEYYDSRDEAYYMKKHFGVEE